MREDIQTLRNDWLTDNVISFWEEYVIIFTPMDLIIDSLLHRYLEHEYLSKLEHANIILLRPSMSFMLLQTSDPRTLRDALPDFTKATHVFLPINDCRNVTEAEGGSHWSLLVVSIVDRIAFHYDSLPPGNRMEAYTITMKLGVLLNCPIRFVHLEDAPQQENSSDCGVFVCLNMRCLLLDRILRANSHQKVSMSLAGKRVDASSGRREMLKIIEGFRKEGVRRRSYVFFHPLSLDVVYD